MTLPPMATRAPRRVAAVRAGRRPRRGGPGGAAAGVEDVLGALVARRRGHVDVALGLNF
jgi:hypothetical protein